MPQYEDTLTNALISYRNRVNELICVISLALELIHLSYIYKNNNYIYFKYNLKDILVYRRYKCI